jgi:hypothetical protein
LLGSVAAPIQENKTALNRGAADSCVKMASDHAHMAMGGGSDEEWDAILKILGDVNELQCKHCGVSKGIVKMKPVVCFQDTLRVWFKKGKLSADHLPKTCDVQQARNKLANPTNNKFYSKLKKLDEARDIALKTADIVHMEKIEAEIDTVTKQKDEAQMALPRKIIVRAVAPAPRLVIRVKRV